MRQWRALSVSIALVASMGQSASAEDKVGQIQARYGIDIPAGMFVPKSCSEGTAGGSSYLGDRPACVAYSWPAHENYDGAILAAFNKQGWSIAGGAGNAYYLEKPKDDNCSRRLILIAVIQGDREEADKWGHAEEVDMDWSKIENAIYQAIEDPEPVCGDDRQVSSSE